VVQLPYVVENVHGLHRIIDASENNGIPCMVTSTCYQPLPYRTTKLIHYAVFGMGHLQYPARSWLTVDAMAEWDVCKGKMMKGLSLHRAICECATFYRLECV